MKIEKKYIFQIGFNKTATTSIYMFFVKNGLKSLHWVLENNIEIKIDDIIINNKIKYDKFIKSNEYSSINLLDKIDDYDVFTDIEEIRKNFKLLEKIYPNSKFIYNIRNIDDWVKSRLNHMNKNYTKYLNYINNTDYTDEEFIEMWKNEYYNHYNDVIDYFKDKKNKLLIYDIDKDKFDKIVDFLPEFNLNNLNNLNIYENKTMLI